METYNIFYLISVRVEEGEGLGAKPDPLPELRAEPVHQGHHLRRGHHGGQEHEDVGQELVENMIMMVKNMKRSIKVNQLLTWPFILTTWSKFSFICACKVSIFMSASFSSKEFRS